MCQIQACQSLRASYPACHPRASMVKTRDWNFHIQGERLSSRCGLLFQMSRRLPVIHKDCKPRDLTPENLLWNPWQTRHSHCRQHAILEQWVCSVFRRVELRSWDIKSSPGPIQWEKWEISWNNKAANEKASEEGRDMHLALLAYRNRPISGLEYSPAQLLMSRVLKDRLSTATSLLSPKVAEDLHRSLLARQQRQKRFHDRGTKALPALQTGVPVTVQQGRTWHPAIVVEKHEAPRSFKVRTEDGQILRRNRNFLRQSMEAEPTQPDQVTSPATLTED